MFSVRKNNKNLGMPENNLLSLSYGNIVRKDMNNNEGLIPESYETYQIVYPGDIVLRLTDLQNDKRSIRQGLVKEKGIVTSAYDAVYVSKNHDPAFWAYTLLSLDLAKYYYSLGGGVRQSIKFKDIPNMLVKFPDLEEQRRIAIGIESKIRKMDELIGKIELSIKYLKELKSSIVTEAVTGNLDITKWKNRGTSNYQLVKIENNIANSKKVTT
ncbi:restriction endonuclease subunit S [Emticicia sp. BO119]|nr:restriction endonuclease subunit S [Emticicia sp. BO119]